MRRETGRGDQTPAWPSDGRGARDGKTRGRRGAKRKGERDTTAIGLVWAGVFASPERSTKGPWRWRW